MQIYFLFSLFASQPNSKLYGFAYGIVEDPSRIIFEQII